MRLCRFVQDEIIHLGFYRDDGVIPVGEAVEAFNAGKPPAEAVFLPVTEDPLDLLPPDGPWSEPARDVDRWLGRLAAERRAALTLPLAAVKLLAPVARPPKVLLLAGNYAKHVEERGGVAAERAETFPYVFMKPPSTTLTDPGGPIVLPRDSPDFIDWECELGVVIGRRGRAIPEAEALGYVAGYTVVNDVTDRQFRPNPGRKARERDKHFDWLHGKWHDTFLPMGPCLASADALPDPQGLRLRLEVNGQVKQDGTTAQMVFPVAAVIAFVSSFVTLEPGDVLSTGTPSGVGSASGQYLRPGDVVTAWVEGIGSLTNRVISADEAAAAGS